MVINALHDFKKYRPSSRRGDREGGTERGNGWRWKVGMIQVGVQNKKSFHGTACHILGFMHQPEKDLPEAVSKRTRPHKRLEACSPPHHSNITSPAVPINLKIIRYLLSTTYSHVTTDDAGHRAQQLGWNLDTMFGATLNERQYGILIDAGIRTAEVELHSEFNINRNGGLSMSSPRSEDDCDGLADIPSRNGVSAAMELVVGVKNVDKRSRRIILVRLRA
ncbi:hypothetical protein EDD18DRAFT_1098965 [Armillaria luteobubalina]|uniref:Uncharacterized protein n=1 Tax=Armillaria luteobubalina TaxID=153913 RepID=A0AA39QL11_9AGAR|nr:hypothetical protein EDD18DRAFT_1098965 [Armillaria luteobubalina]